MATLAPMTNSRRLLALLTCALAALAVAGCGSDSGGAGASTAPPAAQATVTNSTGETCAAREPSPAADPASYAKEPPLTIDTAAAYRATLLTSCGPIVIALDAAAAPRTVNSFVFLAREGFFDGLTFHRVVTGFVIQGGDPEGSGAGGPGYELPDELPTDGYAVGDVAMANAGPDTSGSQFFIGTGEGVAQLPNAYTKFGRVVKGLDVAKTIEGFADPNADPGDPSAQTPTSPIYIYKVTITGP